MRKHLLVLLATPVKYSCPHVVQKWQVVCLIYISYLSSKQLFWITLLSIKVLGIHDVFQFHNKYYVIFFFKMPLFSCLIHECMSGKIENTLDCVEAQKPRILTPRWAAEWRSIIPCIIQESKLTLSRHSLSIKGTAITAHRLGACKTDSLWWGEWCWWPVRWVVMERQSEVTSRISHPLFQQVALTCGLSLAEGASPDPQRTRSRTGL